MSSFVLCRATQNNRQFRVFGRPAGRPPRVGPTSALLSDVIIIIIIIYDWLSGVWRVPKTTAEKTTTTACNNDNNTKIKNNNNNGKKKHKHTHTLTRYTTTTYTSPRTFHSANGTTRPVVLTRPRHRGSCDATHLARNTSYWPTPTRTKRLLFPVLFRFDVLKSYQWFRSTDRITGLLYEKTTMVLSR